MGNRATVATDGGARALARLLVNDEQNDLGLRDRPLKQKARTVDILMERGFREKVLSNLDKASDKVVGLVGYACFMRGRHAVLCRRCATRRCPGAVSAMADF